MSWKEPFLDKGYYVFMDNYYTAVGGTRGKENFGLLVRAKPAQRHLWCKVKPGKNSEKRRVPLQTERYFDLHDMLWQKICQFLRHWTHKRRWFWCCGKISESNWPLYNAYMGDADVFDQRVNLYARLLRGAVWYYKIFSYLIEVCVLNAHILERKSPNHTTRTALDFRKS